MLNFCHQGRQKNFILLVRFTHDRATGAVDKSVIYPGDQFPVDRSLAKFCDPYPEISTDTTYSFCLTSQTSTPTYGYVILKIEKQKATSFCLLSQFFYPKDYFTILSRYVESKSTRAVEAQTVRDADWNDVKPQQVVRECITFGLSVFSLCDIGRILIAMLLDCRLVVVGQSVEAVERFCYSLLAFVHPLRWPGVFVPVLPVGLEGTLYAPFPYIIGIHPSMLAATEVDEMESHVVVNIDRRAYSFERMDMKLPRDLEKRLESLPELVRDVGIDVAYRQLMLGAVECACKCPSKDVKVLVERYKHKRQKMRAGNASFKSAVLQSQLVQALMQGVETGPGGEVFVAFTERDKTIELKPQVGPSLLAEKPKAKKKPLDPLQHIMSLADQFSMRNRDIEAKIRDSRVGTRPSSCEVASPEALPFRSRLAIFEQPGPDQSRLVKNRTVSEIRQGRRK